MADYFSKLLRDRYEEDLVSNPYAAANKYFPKEVDYSGDKWYEAAAKGLLVGGLDGFTQRMAVESAREQRDKNLTQMGRAAQIIANGGSNAEIENLGLPSELTTSLVLEKMQNDVKQKSDLDLLAKRISMTEAASNRARAANRFALGTQGSELLGRYLKGEDGQTPNLEGVPIDVLQLATRMKLSDNQLASSLAYTEMSGQNNDRKNLDAMAKHAGVEGILDVPGLTGVTDLDGGGIRLYSKKLFSDKPFERDLQKNVIRPTAEMLGDIEKVKGFIGTGAFDSFTGEEAEILKRVELLNRGAIRTVLGLGARLEGSELKQLLAAELPTFLNDPVGWLKANAQGVANADKRLAILDGVQKAMHQGMMKKINPLYSTRQDPQHAVIRSQMMGQLLNNIGIEQNSITAPVSPLEGWADPAPELSAGSGEPQREAGESESAYVKRLSQYFIENGITE